MPTTYTHYRFGKEVLACLPFPIRTSIENHQELYDIGLHGPDILFYYKALHKNHVNQDGFRIHAEPASNFFLQAKELLEQCSDKTAGRIYLYGFVCHFTLDSICHPYVEKMIHVCEFGHCELENELDRYYLQKDGINPATYKTGKLICPSRDNAQIIATFFEGITMEELAKALKDMVRDLNLLHPKTASMKKIVRAILKAAHQDILRELVLRPSAPAGCEKYCHILAKLYEEAIPVACSLIQRYQDVLLNGASLPERFDLNFNAGDRWENLLV